MNFHGPTPPASYRYLSVSNQVGDMHQVDIHKAISRLLKLMAETESGGETAVIGAGELSAKPTSYDQRSQPRRPGRLRNKL